MHSLAAVPLVGLNCYYKTASQSHPTRNLLVTTTSTFAFLLLTPNFHTYVKNPNIQRFLIDALVFTKTVEFAQITRLFGEFRNFLKCLYCDYWTRSNHGSEFFVR